MKKNESNWWLRALLLLVVLIILYRVFKRAVHFIEEHKKELQQKWLAKHNEIRALLHEKHRVRKLILKAKYYSYVTISCLKFTLFFVFVGFTAMLQKYYHMDIFTAIGTSGSAVVTTYSIIVILFNRRIKGLNEIHEMISNKVQEFFEKKLELELGRIQYIDIKVEILRKEANQLKQSFDS